VPVGVDDGVVVVDVVEPVAAFTTPELSTKPPSAPPSIEPAARIVTIHLFPIFTCHLLSFVVWRLAAVLRKRVRASCEFDESA
jgi:hypothetical protein